jgi:hypothetical protein
MSPMSLFLLEIFVGSRSYTHEKDAFFATPSTMKVVHAISKCRKSRIDFVPRDDDFRLHTTCMYIHVSPKRLSW